ncbi:MAG TPA: response regulator [Clostridiaceae bacterium]|nr:response regulator [Clostridiaceae bacterium]
MYKLIIVDDEKESREGLKRIVDWSSMNIVIVGEAEDGIEALELIQNTQPDIMICDIRMPRLDGLSLLSRIHTKYPHLQVLLLSSYSEKEYLKSAIHFGVVDYIYKPFSLHELIDAVKRAQDKYEQSILHANKNESNNLAITLIEKPTSVSTPVFKGSNNNSVDSNSSNYNNNCYNINEYISLAIKFKNCANNESSINISYDDNIKDMLFTQQHFAKFYDSLTFIFKNNFVMSAIPTGYIVHIAVPQLYSIHQDLIPCLKPLFSIITDPEKAMCIGIGNKVKTIMQLKESYRNACLASKYAFLLGYGREYYIEDMSKQRFTKNNTAYNSFFECIENAKFTQAIKILDDYLCEMSHSRAEDIPEIINHLAVISYKLYEKLGTYNDKDSISCSKQIYLMNDLNEIKNHLFELIDEIAYQFNNLNNKGRIIFEVERYIMNNYNKDLSIKTIAENVFLTPTYLCYLYKKNTGKTLYEFIQEVRMSKAKQLLKDSFYTLAEISYMTGYNNQNNFTRNFKKYFGISPTEYRNSFL